MKRANTEKKKKGGQIGESFKEVARAIPPITKKAAQRIKEALINKKEKTRGIVSAIIEAITIVQ